MNYARTVRNVPQTQPVVGLNMVKNNAGGYGFKVEDFDRMKKFITIGTEGGTYYVDERTLTIAEAEATTRVLRSNPVKAIDEILAVLRDNRAHKRNAALFALALASDPKIVTEAEHRSRVFAALPNILRTGTDLFIYVGYVAQLRGHGGQGLQKALSNWYTSKTPEQLAYQLMKYQSREGWSHRDILRIARPGAGKRSGFTSPEHRALVRWALSGFASDVDTYNVAPNPLGRLDVTLPNRVIAVNLLRRNQNATPSEVARLIREFDLPREVIPTHFLTEKVVWEALVERMPMLATIRNLGNMSKNGLLGKFDATEKTVISRLTDAAAVAKSGIHPFHVLLAARTYRKGSGDLGKGTWPVNGEVVAALDKTLRASLRNPTPSGKNILVAVDVSGSMSSVADKAYTLAYCFRAIESNSRVIEFDMAGGGYYQSRRPSTSSGGVQGTYESNINANSNLDQVLNGIRYGGGTDVSLPFQYVQHHKLENKLDAIIMLTDSESWGGGRHAFTYLDQIRQKNPALKAVEVQLAPGYHKQLRGDPRELLVCGFDASVYQVVSEFIAQ